MKLLQSDFNTSITLFSAKPTPKPSPVDCELGPWNDCNATCGTGLRSRIIVQEALYGGKECSTNRTIECNLDKPCPEEKTGTLVIIVNVFIRVFRYLVFLWFRRTN